MKKYKLFIFDLDGVIVDTKLNMKASWKAVKIINNIKVSFKDYFSLIGSPFNNILSDLKIHEKQKEIANTYAKESLKKSSLIKIFPEIKLTLEKLRKKNKIAIVTSKDRNRTKLILKQFKLSFDLISCPEKNLRGKPYPDQILKVLRNLSINKEDCVYIGDMYVDYTAALNAKVDFFLVNYGYEKEHIKKIKKIKKISKIKNLLKYQY